MSRMLRKIYDISAAYRYARMNKNFRKLKYISRYHPGSVILFGNDFDYIDTLSFLSMYEDIFVEKIYDFASETDRPRIIDGGSNIGLSLLFFKRRYPRSSIIAFEPYEKAYEVCKSNIERFEIDDNIVLINKALWSSEGEMVLKTDGADGSRIDIDCSRGDNKVRTVRLKDYLKDAPVDFLKLDIEGGEWEVLNDCSSSLGNVRNIFIEYHSFLHEDQFLGKILELLRVNRFRYWIISRQVSGAPFSRIKIKRGMDMRVHVFASKA